MKVHKDTCLQVIENDPEAFEGRQEAMREEIERASCNPAREVTEADVVRIFGPYAKEVIALARKSEARVPNVPPLENT
jgi:hypothetical protein